MEYKEIVKKGSQLIKKGKITRKQVYDFNPLNDKDQLISDECKQLALIWREIKFKNWVKTLKTEERDIVLLFDRGYNRNEVAEIININRVKLNILIKKIKKDYKKNYLEENDD